MRLRRSVVLVICVVLVIVAGLIWILILGPARMVAAIQRGDVRTVGIFARLGIRPDSDVFLMGGFTHCAAASGKLEVMQKLQDLGASINRLDGYGATPLHAAVRARRIESVRWLLAHGADPSVKYRQGCTAAEYVATDVPEQQREEFLSVLEQASGRAGRRRLCQ